MPFINKKGFSVVELLVCIVIFLTLSYLGFTAWNQHLSTTWQTEAKANLALAHINQEKHKQTCGTYYPDLRAIGTRFDGEINYNIGGDYAPADFTSTLSCIKTDADCHNSSGTNCRNQVVDVNTSANSLCCAFSDFENDVANCSCGYQPPAKVNVADYASSLTAGEKRIIYGAPPHTGKPFGIEQAKYLMFAVSDFSEAGTRSEFNVWAVNHKGAIKSVQ